MGRSRVTLPGITQMCVSVFPAFSVSECSCERVKASAEVRVGMQFIICPADGPRGQGPWC